MSNRINDALELIDLGDWLSDYAETKSGGGYELRLAECPDCGNDEYKLYVNTEKQRWVCYVCDWGRGKGDVTQLMAKVSGRSLGSIRIELAKLVPPAIKGDLTAALNLAFDGEDEDAEEDNEAIELPGSADFSSITGRKVLVYANGRGVAPQLVRSLGLRAAASLFIKKKTLKPIKIKGPFLVFPVMMGGVAVSWQGRRTYKSKIPYISNSNVKDWLWPLGPELFQVYTQGRLVIVEGVFDALGFILQGIPAVCTFGKSLSVQQLALLQELNPKEIVFAWDLDAKKEIQRAVTRVSYHFPQTSVVSFDTPTGEKVDPGDGLVDPAIAQWIVSKLDAATDVRSPEYFKWLMKI